MIPGKVFLLAVLAVVESGDFCNLTLAASVEPEQQVKPLSNESSMSLVGEWLKHQHLLQSGSAASSNYQLSIFAAIATEDDGMTFGFRSLDCTNLALQQKLFERFKPTNADETQLSRAIRCSSEETEVAKPLCTYRFGSNRKFTRIGSRPVLLGINQIAGNRTKVGFSIKKRLHITRRTKSNWFLSIFYFMPRSFETTDSAFNCVMVEKDFENSLSPYSDQNDEMIFGTKYRESYVFKNGIAQASEQNDELQIVVEILKEMGYIGRADNGKVPDKSAIENAIKSYQRDRNLPETGIVDDDTFYTITDEWKYN